MALKKKTVSIYLDPINFDKLKLVTSLQEQSQSRWLGQKVIKLVDKEYKKLTTRSK